MPLSGINKEVKRLLIIVLRIPPLLVINSVLNGSFCSLAFAWLEDVEMKVDTPANIIVRFLVGSVCVLGSLLIFVLDKWWLLDVYSLLLALGALMLSFCLNSKLTDLPSFGPFMEISSENWEGMRNILLQFIMAFSYNGLMQQELKMPMKTANYVCFIQPAMLQIMDLPAAHVKLAAKLSLFLPLGELLWRMVPRIRTIVQMTKNAYQSAWHVFNTYGFQSFLEHHWLRLDVPTTLRLFYLCRLAYHVTAINGILEAPVLEERSVPQNLGLQTAGDQKIMEAWQYLLTSGCDTVISLLAMTSIISYIAHVVGSIAAVCIGSSNEEDQNIGSVAAILFFILALQTGLTGLEPDRRLNRMYKNICLLITAIVHFIHSMVYPLLMNLGASYNPLYTKHVRALFMCFLLITFSSCFGYHLWTNHPVSTWLLAVTAFSIEVIFKFIITLTVYSLFIIDACRVTFWEKLDDYIYYVKAIGNTIEFLFGIFLFCNGAWIFIFESGGAIRAFMMCVHAYFNIWVQAKEGWKVFTMRQTAVKKINLLPKASYEQIEEYNDVCAICYQELQHACVTGCKHLFHSVCLRKWLYIQDKCPICHTLIYRVKTTANHPTQ